MKHLKVLSLAPLLGAVSAGAADAAAVRITDLVTGDTVTLQDNAPGDLDSDVGVILWDLDLSAVGTMSSVWEPVITVAFSKPTLGTPGAHAEISASVASNSSGAGTIVVEFSDTGFTLPADRSYRTGLAFGTDTDLPGTVIDGSAYIDAGNGLFSPATLIGSPFGFTGITDPDSFSDELHTLLPPDPDGVFSLLNVLTIQHTGRALTEAELTTELSAVPLPGAALLMGSALAGFAAQRRKRAGAATD